MEKNKKKDNTLVLRERLHKIPSRLPLPEGGEILPPLKKGD
jgi:hypothetical protein